MTDIVLAVTGATGAAYARRLARLVLDAGCRLHLIASPRGLAMIHAELHTDGPLGRALLNQDEDNLVVHEYGQLADRLASGSTHTDGMAVCPCTCNTLADIAAGRGDNLITRAAAVHLKQRRPLVLVPREMPVSAIDLENQLTLARAGATIAPASPGFYLGATSVADLVDFVAGRVADCLGVPHDLPIRYPGEAE